MRKPTMSQENNPPNDTGISDDFDPDELENYTDEELLKTLKSLEQEKELLAQQQLLKEIERLQEELRQHEIQRKEKRMSLTGDDAVKFAIEDLPIEELADRLEELKKQRDDLSNTRLMAEIEALQRDIQRLQTESDHRETRVLATDAVAVYALSPTEIEVRWKSSEFGDVESYNIFYKQANDDSEEESIMVESDATSCTIQGLVGNTGYHIRMEAEGKDKSEIKTDVVEVKTFRPAFVLILANYDGFQLKALNNLNAMKQDVDDLKNSFEKMGFEVALEENITGEKMMQSINNYKQKLELSSIDCFILVLTSYKYHGYIFGTDGGVLMNKLMDCLKYDRNSDSSLAEDKPRIVLFDTIKIKEETIEDLDHSYQPRNVKIRYTDISRVEISFRPPKLAEESVTKFVVTLKRQDKPPNIKYLEAVPFKEVYCCEFTKLTLGQEYKCEIYAVYPSHNGKPINAVVKTQNTSSKDFLCPRHLGVEIISQSQVYVFWKPVTTGITDAIMYRVNLLNTATEEEEENTVVSYPCHVFDNLKMNTLYKIQVSTLKRENNKTEESEPVEMSITTPQDGTPIIMADSTTANILGEPHFLVATACGPYMPDETKSFLKCFRQHMQRKYHRYDLANLLQDARNEIVYTSGRYEVPVVSSTLDHPVFLGQPSKQ